MAFSATATPQEDGTILFTLEGRLDVKAARDAEAAFAEVLAEPANVILDLSDLSYIASAGLRLIKRVHKMAGDAGYTVTVKNPSEDVMEVFEMTGFAAMLKFE